MGEQAVSVVIAAMLERGEAIRSPGGYLRDLTDEEDRSASSIYQMLQALEGRGLDGRVPVDRIVRG